MANSNKLEIDVKKMFRWAILKALDKNPGTKVSLKKLRLYLTDVWEHMVEDGEIVFNDDAYDDVLEYNGKL